MLLSKNLSSIKGLDARKAAWEVIQAVGGGAFADVALERIFNLYSFKSIDKALKLNFLMVQFAKDIFWIVGLIF